MEKDNYIGMLLDNRYKVEQLIGVGGMARVFTAKDIKEDRTVAVKILKDEIANNRESVKKFINESKVLATLSHPSIVEVFDASFDNDIKFMVMEYIDGITLKEYMETSGGPLSWKDSVHFTIQILRALQHAHARGVIHRDIKPHNVMLLTDGTIKVTDFGISKIAREEVKSSTEHTLGSVHYISPEQAQGLSTNEKSDIYSLGCVLYEMLTGKKPFDSDNPVTVALMHSKDIAPAPSSINSDIPKGLEQIILKAMEKNPDDRYQSASEMIQALQMFRKNPDILFNYGENQGEEELSDEVKERVSVIAEGGGFVVDDAYSNTSEIPIVPPTKEVSIEEPDDEYPDEEVEVERSFFLPILTGITLVIILVAVIFVASLLKDAFATDSWKNPEFQMPNLVGMQLEDAKEMYSTQLDIAVSAEQYSETYEEGAIMEQSVEEGLLCKNGVGVDVIISKGVKMVTVPDVLSFDYTVAEKTLKNEGLLVETKFQYDDDIEKDLVVKTEPSAKEEVAPGTKVVLYVSKGRYVSVVKVPNLTGMTLDAAKAMVESKDLTWTIVYQNSEQAKDIVIDQSIQPESEVDSKTEITIYVSDGNPPTNSISVNFPLPSNAYGTFTFQIFIDGTLSTQKTVEADATDGQTKITLEGNGTQLVVVKVKNDSNNKTAEYGRYNINFDDGGTIEVISSKSDQAFVEIDGILVVTQTVTYATVYEEPAETDPVYEEAQEPDYEETQAPADVQAPVDTQADDDSNADDNTDDNADAT